MVLKSKLITNEKEIIFDEAGVKSGLGSAD